MSVCLVIFPLLKSYQSNPHQPWGCHPAHLISPQYLPQGPAYHHIGGDVSALLTFLAYSQVANHSQTLAAFWVLVDPLLLQHLRLQQPMSIFLSHRNQIQHEHKCEQRRWRIHRYILLRKFANKVTWKTFLYENHVGKWWIGICFSSKVIFTVSHIPTPFHVGTYGTTLWWYFFTVMCLTVRTLWLWYSMSVPARNLLPRAIQPDALASWAVTGKFGVGKGIECCSFFLSLPT